MKLVSSLLCALALLAFAQEPAKKLTPEEMKELIANTKNVLVLDVREVAELEEFGVIKDSQNVPVGQVEARLAEIPKDRPIITTCTRAVRAGRAAAILQKNGYNVIGRGALAEWKEKNFELVPPPKPSK